MDRTFGWATGSGTELSEVTKMLEDRHGLARRILLDAIRPALSALQKGGRASEQLLLGTAIQESLLVHREQLNGGPALGLFQMEGETHTDCWVNYLDFRDGLADKVRQTLSPGEDPAAETMKINDGYAAAMCRVKYLRVPKALPPADDISGMADYWKQYYNTPLGAGTPDEFLEKWPQFVGESTFE